MLKKPNKNKILKDTGTVLMLVFVVVLVMAVTTLTCMVVTYAIHRPEPLPLEQVILLPWLD